MELADLEEMSLEDISDAYAECLQREEDTRWERGMILAHLLDRRGMLPRAVSSLLGCSPAQVRELAKTWRAFPTEESRARDLSFMHHRLAAGTENPAWWIDRAVANGWSTRRLREEIRAAQGPGALRDMLREKAERSLRMVREVLVQGGEVSEWLREQLTVVLGLCGASRG